jgi:hypothetical protein
MKFIMNFVTWGVTPTSRCKMRHPPLRDRARSSPTGPPTHPATLLLDEAPDVDVVNDDVHGVVTHANE